MNDNYSQYQEYSDESPLSANGRFGRLSYFGWNMLIGLVSFAVVFIIMVIIGASSAIFSSSTDPTESSLGSIGFFSIIIAIIFYLVIVYFTTIFSIRRLHDLNLTGWLCLLLFIPVINFFFILYLWFAAGTKGENDYGLPHETKGWEQVLGWINIILMPVVIIGVLAAIAIPAYQSYVEQAQQQQAQISAIENDVQAGEQELRVLEQQYRTEMQNQQNTEQAASSATAAY